MLYNRLVRVAVDTAIHAVFFAAAWFAVSLWAAAAISAYGLWNYWDGLTRRFCK